LIGGAVGMAIALFAVAVTFAINGATLGKTAAIVAVVSLIVYTGSFAIGPGPVFWLLNAISNAGTFFLMGSVTLVAVAYFWRKVAETRSLTLEEFERQMA
jgi:hypothetical protein